MYTAFSQWYIISQLHNITAKNEHKVRCTLYVISPMSLQHNTSYKKCSAEHFLKCILTVILVCTVDHINNRKTVCILNVVDDAVSIQLLYRNALDIHCKHTASQLHVAERVLRGRIGSPWALSNGDIADDLEWPLCHNLPHFVHSTTVLISL